MNRRRVLIETSWNVKVEIVGYYFPSISVLIETSWNVKQDISGVILKNDVSINRNIVECKELCNL